MHLMQKRPSRTIGILPWFCALVVIASGFVLAQDPDSAPRASRFALYDRATAEVLAPIGHGATVSTQRADGRTADAVLLRLPADAGGPVELYVNQAYRGVLDGPPFIVPLADLPRRGAVTLLAVPDVGYPTEVRFTLD